MAEYAQIVMVPTRATQEQFAEAVDLLWQDWLRQQALHPALAGQSPEFSARQMDTWGSRPRYVGVSWYIAADGTGEAR